MDDLFKSLDFLQNLIDENVLHKTKTIIFEPTIMENK